MEQLLNSSPNYLQVWLQERKPTSLKILTEMADQYLAIHGKANKPREFKNGKYETKDKNGSKSQKRWIHRS